VIDPAVEYVTNKYPGQKIGLIGTQQTVQSQVYNKKIANIDPSIELCSLPTKLLAPMIEEGFFNNSISEQIIYNYLSDPHLADIKALILGCTHYPLIKNEIEKFYTRPIEVIDSSIVVAESLQKQMNEKQILNQDLNNNPIQKFYVSDYTHSFEAATQIFFGKSVKLNYFKLWE
jgi:glutamate racemase